MRYRSRSRSRRPIRGSRRRGSAGRRSFGRRRAPLRLRIGYRM